MPRDLNGMSGYRGSSALLSPPLLLPILRYPELRAGGRSSCGRGLYKDVMTGVYPVLISHGIVDAGGILRLVVEEPFGSIVGRKQSEALFGRGIQKYSPGPEHSGLGVLIGEKKSGVLSGGRILKHNEG